MFTQKVYAEVCLGNPRHPIVIKSRDDCIVSNNSSTVFYFSFLHCNPIYFSLNFLSYSFEYLSTIGALSVT